MDIRDIIKTKYPIIQGGMANIATGEFAAAISNAGGLGLIAAGGMKPDQLRENIDRARELTDKPFGVNIMLMSVALAQRMERLGVDAVIAEGTESGGHVGEMTTMALVPQVVDGVSIPVVAAGGIASGRQMLAAYALGACGVQVGTCLLVSEECPVHQNYKQAVLDASDSDTIVTGRIGGTPVRVLKNRMAREYVRQERAGATKEELEVYTLGSLRKAVFDGNVKEGSLMAGQVAGQLHEIRPAAVILEEMYTSFCQLKKDLAKDCD